MKIFAAAIDDLFLDPNLAREAIYRADGTAPGIPLRVIVRRPDRIGDFGETRLAAATITIEARTSELATPAEGDILMLQDESFVVQGAPLRDSERLVWTLEARPA